MNHQELKSILENLKNKQYIESDITHTFSENHNAVFSVKYSKNNKTFEVKEIETDSTEEFIDVDTTMSRIHTLLSK